MRKTVNFSIVNKKTGMKVASFYDSESEYGKNVSLKKWQKQWEKYQANPDNFIVVSTIKTLEAKLPEPSSDDELDLD